MQIPLNFVTYPGVSLSSACFAHGVYQTDAAARCISNLLATGFRRFIVDVYWDAGRRAWSLCPVELPTSASSAPTSPGSTISPTVSSSVSITAADITARHVAARSAGPNPDGNGENLALFARQVTTSSKSSSTTKTSGSNTEDRSSTATSLSSSSQNGTTSASASAAPAPNGQSLIANGPFQCSSSIDLSVFTTVLVEYIQSSSNTLAAIMTLVDFNIHVAAPMLSPTSPAPALNSSTVPSSTEALRNELSVSLSSVLYTPKMLANERSNLNTSWLGVSENLRPNTVFFNTTKNSAGDLVTNNGWPSESYAEFAKLYRLMVSFGSIDSQFATYKTATDEQVIFPSGALSANTDISFDTTGSLRQGCYFDNGKTDVSAANNSWAITTQSNLPQTFLKTNVTSISSVSNLTNCGISPVLNTTLSNVTADVNIAPYQSYAFNSIWSWSFGEPRNVSASESNSKLTRCALLDTALSGRWRVADCTEHHYAACRTNNEPYIWKLTTGAGTYSSSDEICPGGTTFAAPRSGLENSYLHAAAAEQHKASGSSDSMGLWVNFNSLDVEGCWVTGVESTCPYTGAGVINRGRDVIVPIVAAIIVFLIAVLTVFVKCAGNRRDMKRGRRRRRGDDGWGYEGVPS